MGFFCFEILFGVFQRLSVLVVLIFVGEQGQKVVVFDIFWEEESLVESVGYIISSCMQKVEIAARNGRISPFFC